MKDETGCREFQELLDRVALGAISREDEIQLNKHAGECPDCAMLLEMHRHLISPSGPELEAAVPDGMVDTMWRRVMADISQQSAGRNAAGSRLWPVMKLLVPALSVVVVILTFASGFMFSELRQLRSREQELIHEVGHRDELISHMSAEQDDFPRGRGIFSAGNMMIRRGLPQQEIFTAEELLTLLNKLPPDVTIMGPDEARSLLSHRVLSQNVGSADLPAYIDLWDGLQAEELIRLVGWLGLDPGETISRDRVLALTNQI
ncbi:MAG: zf-HC2 domain-containing protein [Bacteroidales bacterium]|nr:zf-HC2 domain-containing protein [Candidatus Latescibacterota bacterium]